MAPSHPTLLYGAANLGSDWGGDATTEEGFPRMLDALARLGVKRIDTAGVYPPEGVSGGSERLLAATGTTTHPAGFIIDTKVNFEIGKSNGALKADKIRDNTSKSLENLGVNQVNVMYAHIPDNETPLEEQVEGFEEQRRTGRCKAIGISNFTPQMVEDWVAICKEKGYPLPAVYQGNYSIAARHEEATLFPVLRKHGIAFLAYSPLASGFLSGKLTAGDVGANSRFASTSHIGDILRAAFDRPALHDAIRALQPVLADAGITPPAAALRWIAYHSALRPELGDGIILGASRVEQMEQNVAAINAGPLPAEIVKALEDIWTKAAAAPAS